MLIELAESYVKALNGGKVTTIENAWNYVQASELERAFKEVVVEIEKTVTLKIEAQMPLNQSQLKKLVQDVKTEAFTRFKS